MTVDVKRYLELSDIVHNLNPTRENIYIKGRKQAILEYLSMQQQLRSLEEYPEGISYVGNGIAVNRQWQLHTKYDKDILALMRDGKVKLIRGYRSLHKMHKYGRKKASSSQTYVVLA